MATFKPIFGSSASIPYGFIDKPVSSGPSTYSPGSPGNSGPSSATPSGTGFGLGGSFMPDGGSNDPAKTVITGGTSSPYVGSGNGDKPFASYEKGNKDMITRPDMNRWQDGEIGPYWTETGLLDPYGGPSNDMGVRPGLSPPMNAVQAARMAAGQEPGMGSQNFSPLPNPTGQGGRRADPNSGPGVPGGLGGSNPDLPFTPRRY